MPPEDRIYALAEVCDFFLKQHALHVTFAKATQLRFENLERAMALLVGACQLPGGPD